MQLLLGSTQISHGQIIGRDDDGTVLIKAIGLEKTVAPRNQYFTGRKERNQMDKRHTMFSLLPTYQVGMASARSTAYRVPRSAGQWNSLRRTRSMESSVLNFRPFGNAPNMSLAKVE
jgi:hypothetical protein